MHAPHSMYGRENKLLAVPWVWGDDGWSGSEGGPGGMLSFGFSPAGSSRSLCVACGGTRQSQAADPSSLMREEMSGG